MKLIMVEGGNNRMERRGDDSREIPIERSIFPDKDKHSSKFSSSSSLIRSVIELSGIVGEEEEKGEILLLLLLISSLQRLKWNWRT